MSVAETERTPTTPTQSDRRPSAHRSRLWSALLLPPTAWMVMFFVSSVVIVVLLSFGITGYDGDPRFSTTLANYRGIWNATYLHLLIRSLSYAVVTVAICVLIAYPVAYAIALHGGRYKHALIAAVVVPFFASYLVRMYAWSTLLSDEGVVNKLLRDTGISDGVTFLNTPGAVIAGLVYGFVVFMILPIYASLERMDLALIEAGKDLYHGPFLTFVHVTLPATRAGLYGGMLLVFLPAFGDFVSAQLLGGPSTYMIGNLVQQQFFEGQNWPLGSALTVGLMAALTLIMVGYLRVTSPPRRES
jgi:spermidine/putrescine transport system permease protein